MVVGEERTFRKLLILSLFFIGTILTIIIAFVSRLAWDSTNTAIVFYLMIGLLSIACSGLILIQFGIKEDPVLTAFHSALWFSALVNTGRSIFLLFEPNVAFMLNTPLELVSDLFFLLIFESLVLISVKLRNSILSTKKQIIITFSLIGLSCAIYWFCYALLLPIMPAESLFVIGFFLGLIGTIAIMLAAYIWTRPTTRSSRFSFNLMLVGLALFTGTWIPTMQTILEPDSLWQVLFVQKVFGLFFMNFAIALPFLIRLGMKKRSAFSWIAALIIMVYIPILATVPSEIFASGFSLVNSSILGFVHAAGAILSGALGYLLYAHSRLKPSRDRFPILAIYVIWFTLETFQTINWLFFEFIAMPLLPDLVGSFTILLLLPLVIRWNKNLQENTNHLSSKYFFLIIPMLLLCSIFGNWVFNFAELNFINLIDLPLGRAVLLILNVAIIFPYTYLLASLVKQSRGAISIDLLAVFFLSFWFGSGIIKATSLFWSGGFWIGEIIRVLGLMLGPVAIGLLYIHEMQKAETYHRKATLFSDVLVHDISNYHQAISICLGILEMEESSDKLKRQSLQDAKTELTRADQLVSNVRRIGSADEISSDSIVSIDLVEYIQQAYSRVSIIPTADKLEFTIDKETGECFVLANSLIVDIFQNLFNNAIQYSHDEKIINVEIVKRFDSGKLWWLTRVIDHSQGIPPEKKEILFQRYMKGAKGTGLGLSVVKALVDVFHGKIYISDRVEGDYSKGTVFTILLPVG